MHRTSVLAILTAGTFVLAAGTVSPAVAGSPGVPVHIVAHTSFVGGATFESSVPGCETGDVVNGDDATTRFTPWGGVFSSDKLFTCDSGAAGFTLALRARFGSDGSTGSWTVVSGWGTLAGVKGSGSLVGIPISDTGIDDVYTGSFR